MSPIRPRPISQHRNRAARPPRRLAALVLALAGAALGLHAPARAADCDGNGIEDACDLDCGSTGGPCDVPGCGQATDCDANGVPDTCDLASGATGCAFTDTLFENTTGAADSIFAGPPDDTYYGLGGQIVTWEVDCGFVVDGPGPDFTIYEVDSGGAEFASIDVLVSADGVSFASVKSAETPKVEVPGDDAHGNAAFARSYDLGPSGLTAVRFIRVDGNGTGSAGTSTGFDLDAMGVVNRVGRDCDSSGVLDVCEGLQDCNADGVPESCEVAAGAIDDCDSSGTPDTCDTLGGANDCDGDGVPDSCEPDCNVNGTPDDCDIAGATSDDCNANGIPDECDLAGSTVVDSSGLFGPFGSASSASFTIPSAFPSSGDVTVTVTALSDLGASNEYVDVEINGIPVGRVFDTAGAQCAEAVQALIVDAGTFNGAVAGGDATIALLTPAAASATECADSYAWVMVEYDGIRDCNANGQVDACEIAGGSSTDLNANGIADDCEPDCNTNAVPDDWDISQGTSVDCNVNDVPDECDVSSGTSPDCNADGVPDECQPDCNANAVPDDCDLTSGTSQDCNANGVPDECDLAEGAGGCPFPDALLDNATTAPDAVFLGPPDDVYYGLGGQIVTYELDCGFVVDGPGPDLTVYELASGSPEFGSLGDVLVSADGVSFSSVKSTETTAVNVPGDEQHGNNSFARSYDLDGTGLNAVRFVRLDGSGTGSSGTSTGFDLDAVGAVNRIGVDCDASGVLDACEGFGDCNGNALPDACELSSGIDDDCNANATLDACDIASGAPDVDADGVPDECEPDCNANSVPDDFDIEQGTSTDCNDNAIPDGCDITEGTSQDCNNDLVPDECPVCPTVEVTFIMDTSSSMSGEASALCATLTQVVADLQADLIDVDTELLGIMTAGSGSFGCLTDGVAVVYGTTVPGSPPAGNETLGDCPGGNEVAIEDWGRAVSVVAGVKPWQADSVRVVIPISDEGPWCGDPVSNPGVDRDSINHAIVTSVGENVIVSPITGSGSSTAVTTMATLLADNTGGTVFSSSVPAEDLSAGIRSIIEAACDARTDCNANDSPDTCDLSGGTSLDCDFSGVPDECEADCNHNGLNDACDITAGTSLDDNANAIPDECENIVLTLTATDLEWTPVDGALGYDVVQGSLDALRGSDGNFTTSTDACTANDEAGTAVPHGADPPAGDGAWFVVRGVIGSGPLSYDALGSAQAEPRDAEIDAAVPACP